MLFISFEGLDGSGKTTIAKLLCEKLKGEGYPVLFTREPGGSNIAESIREIILNPSNDNMDPWTEALLYISARSQHVTEVILPALKKGQIVICDRFMDSTSVYQGHARGLGIRTVDEIQSTVLGTTKPDLTIFFDLEPEKAINRLKQRQEEELNRFDLELLSFHQRVYEGYQVLISEHPDRFKVINANLPINDVLEQITFLVMEAIENTRDRENING